MLRVIQRKFSPNGFFILGKVLSMYVVISHSELDPVKTEFDDLNNAIVYFAKINGS